MALICEAGHRSDEHKLGRRCPERLKENDKLTWKRCREKVIVEPQPRWCGCGLGIFVEGWCSSCGAVDHNDETRYGHPLSAAVWCPRCGASNHERTGGICPRNDLPASGYRDCHFVIQAPLQDNGSEVGKSLTRPRNRGGRPRKTAAEKQRARREYQREYMKTRRQKHAA